MSTEDTWSYKQMATPKKRYFVFLEICDKGICELLNKLRTIFNQKPFGSNIHVTIRGPYSKPVTEQELDGWYDKIKSDPILIANAGMFENEDESIVYLGVSAAHNSKNIIRITRKFDYPKHKFDFNPHITLYAGTNKDLAKRIYEFLRREQIELVCHSFELSVYGSSPQKELFNEPQQSRRGFMSNLIFSGKVSSDIFVRARNLVHEANDDGILKDNNYLRE